MKKVVIVGKPNVGKSQLFNRLIGENHSVVFSEPGVTRDRISLECFWRNKSFLLTDTGGYTEEIYSFQKEINIQTKIALEEADLIIFLTSFKEGINSDDFAIAKTLKKEKANNVLLVINKCDIFAKHSVEHEKLGFGKGILISAEHGINTGELLNKIVELLNLKEEETQKLKKVKLAIIGKPNVGKSSLVNTLLQEDRVLISEVAGTTRDAIDLDFCFRGDNYTLIDTPGIKRHAQMRSDEKEKYSILRSKKAIARANMILFMLDIAEGITELDERVGGLIYDANIPTLIVANKWDLVVRTNENRVVLEREIRVRFPALKWAPIVFVSAKNNEKLENIFLKIREIEEERYRRINDSSLKLFLSKVVSLFTVPTVQGNKIKLYSLTQVKGQVPTFLIMCNNSKLLHFSYARCIENQIRKSFGYKITPITVIYNTKRS
ncbi:ribosome biogenesis GTPase Der [Candidatus Mycoplasma haematobovis]|uniref:ribosome biogenesis GTPase Der n=1 Tax=Candidatus Mycoplasma haematobovis TaxID=432608 RepID=UPI000B024327|nr:ribosome biogenesis GTPase Der [Candidatus Mycoplasma haematobovis]